MFNLFGPVGQMSGAGPVHGLDLVHGVGPGVQSSVLAWPCLPAQHHVQPDLMCWIQMLASSTLHAGTNMVPRAGSCHVLHHTRFSHTQD